MKQTDIQTSNLKLLWGTRRSLLMTAGLILVSAAVIFLFVMPQISQGYSHFLDWQEAQKTEAELRDKLRQLSDSESSPGFMYESLVNVALPDRKPLLELMQSLSLVSQEAGVTVDSFEMTPGLVATQAATSSQNSSDNLSVDYSITGSFDQINKFMKRIEEVTPFTTIVSLHIGSEVSNITDDDIFTAKITSETYFYAKSVVSGESTQLPKMTAQAEQVLKELRQYAPITVPIQTQIIGGETQPFGETVDLIGRSQEAEE